MGLLERIVRALIYIACVVLGYYLIIWFMAQMGIVLPPNVVKVCFVILILFCILVLIRMFGGSWGPNFRWWPDNRPGP